MNTNIAREAHFSILKKKYRVTSYKDKSPDSKLYKILQKLEEKQDLCQDEITWLENEELFLFLGDYFRWRYLRLSDPIDQSRAFTYYHFITDRSEAIEHFYELKKKFGIDEHFGNDPISPLYVILQKFEESQVLTPEDQNWLEENGLYQVLACYFEQLHHKDENLWNLVKAGKYWRRAKEPEKVINLVGRVKMDDKKLASAILTNRGGAYRDIGNLDKAEKCAEKALDFQPTSYHAYNLLGAINYQCGNIEKGDHCFQKAQDYNSPDSTQEYILKSALENSDYENRDRIAMHLLKRDPEKYSWAQMYIRNDAG